MYVPDSSHKVLEIVDCCNVVVVHFNLHIWVDPPGREGRCGGRRGGEVGGREVEGREVEGGEVKGGGKWKKGEARWDGQREYNV